MGKLRLSVHRKNEQRKKYGVLYHVRVPRDYNASFRSTRRSTIQSLSPPVLLFCITCLFYLNTSEADIGNDTVATR